MKVFVAGATGVLGREAVRRLIEAGHDVSGVARSDEKARSLSAQGAAPVRVDVLDPADVRGVVAGHEVVCNFATHIPVRTGALRRAWYANDRLHAQGSRVLVSAALAAGAGRYMQHSVAFMYAEGGDRWLDENAPLDPPPHGHAVVEAERQAARFADGGGAGIALRFGFFYGPTAPSTRDQLRAARLHVLPMPGPPDAFYTSIHTSDLGTAVVAALDAPSGAYNVVDDEPLTRRDLADVMAAALRIHRMRVPPLPLKRFDYIARSQRVSNKRFRDATGWAPEYRSAREGWPAVVAALR